MGPYSKTLAVILLTMLFLCDAYAQERSIGTSWSFAGIGLAYEQNVNETAFVHVGAQLEMAETFLGRVSSPGGSASFTWNDIIGSTTSRNGNRIIFFAGAGAAAGYSKDFRLKRKEQIMHGGFFGLKGRAGVRIEYGRKVNIAACVAPILGMYLSVKDETLVMRYYRYGLLQTLMPEITISYRF